MDGKPYRLSRPTERRAANAAEATQRQGAQPVASEPGPRAASSRTPDKKKSSKGLIATLITLLILVIAGAGGWFAWSQLQNTSTGIDTNKYQAVFFTNGQVYFGKLRPMNSQYMKLTNIFYLQTQSSDGTNSENPQKTAGDKNNVQLIKLGEEVHGPEDQMIISKDQVLFYENLKSNGKVAQTIAKYNNSH